MSLTLVLGIVLRFAPLGLPPSLVKYGGSTMWALMIYWVLALLLRRWRPAGLLAASGAIATAVEFLKLVRVPWLDAFRSTLPGILLLGRYFAWPDILAYWIAIACGAVLDAAVVRPLAERG